ncbi:MAG: TlpA family protein disulfide reductase, partial [Prevotella sp.]|nr:TlpA family protein disulfide reductase [Prevotella sp.]
AEELEDMSKHMVGGIVPDFSSNTPDGKQMNLYSLRGHIVIIDFWASWCGPCLREVPNLKRIYDQYHPKGLEILGVSLDRTYDPWVKAIKNKGLTWHHVSSLLEFDDPIAKEFHVTAIPRMFILDEKGKIIAQDLRGEDLAKKIEELYKGK